jgi:hypothetical protein
MDPRTNNDDRSSFGFEQKSGLPTVEEEDEDEEFVTQSKARHKRRLQARWRCKTKGHTHCFTIADVCHVRLTDENMDDWVNTMVNSPLMSSTRFWATSDIPPTLTA